MLLLLLPLFTAARLSEGQQGEGVQEIDDTTMEEMVRGDFGEVYLGIACETASLLATVQYTV